MRTLICLLFLAAFGFAVAGWFLDWYQIDFNARKIQADLQRGQEKLQDTIQRAQQQNSAGAVTASTNKATGDNTAKSPTPEQIKELPEEQ